MSTEKKQSRKKEEPKDGGARAKYLQKDIDLGNFETKTRETMRKLIEPIMTKGSKDREMILVLEKEDDKINERLNLLEMAVYKMDSKGGKTKFDEIEDRFLDNEIKMRVFFERLDDKMNNFMTRMEDYVFEIDQKLILLSNYKK